MTGRPMRRREFVTLLGRAAVSTPMLRPLAARAQSVGRMRRVGMLMNIAADDTEATPRIAAFAQGLSELGWTVGRNVQTDTRWGAGNVERYRTSAAELAAL